MTNFSAGAQSLGYLYQIRYALSRFLSVKGDVAMYLEGLDDISFESSGKPVELIQTKHHAEIANLTDSSSDLWKTIRIWCHRLSKNQIDLSEIELVLVTNGMSAPDSIAHYLSVDTDKRSVAKAIEKMDQIAIKSVNQELKQAFVEYLKLLPAQKNQLFDCVSIIVSSPNIIDIQNNIKDRTRYAVRPEYVDEFILRLEGWWFSKAINALVTSTPILSKELNSQIYSLAEEYRLDSLPIHEFEGDIPKTHEIIDRCFVQQLHLIKVGTTRVTNAVSDYYRAYSQRSKWLRGGHLQGTEIKKYEDRLIEEWSRIFHALKDEISGDVDEDQLQKIGREIYNRMELSLNLNIRPRATEPFIMRGTYHSLSNRGHVGWHPEFREKLNHLFNVAMENADDEHNESNA